MHAAFLYVVAPFIIAFAGVGFWRGWLREVVTLGALLISWLALVALGGDLVRLANRIALMISFTTHSGFDSLDPGLLLRQLRTQPLINSAHPDLFLGVLYIIVAIAVFVVSTRQVRSTPKLAEQALGALIGVANGYVMTYMLFRYVISAAHLPLPLAMTPVGVANSLSQYFATLLIGGVVIAVGLALLSTRALPSRGRVRG